MVWIDLHYHYVGIPTDVQLDASFADVLKAVAEKEKEGDEDVHVGFVFSIFVEREPSRADFIALEVRIKTRIEAIEARDGRGRFGGNDFVVTNSYSPEPELELQMA